VVIEVKRLEFEWIEDESGWVFLMPKLSKEDVWRLGLGTFDLADFTFGTANAIPFLYKSIERFRAVEKVLWRVENWLRCLEWALFLRGHYILSEIVSKFRNIIFKVAWWVSVKT